MVSEQLLKREEEIAELKAERNKPRSGGGFSGIDICPVGVTAGFLVAVFKL